MIQANSASIIYIYNSFKELLVIFTSVKTLAKLIHSNHSTLVNCIKNKTLYRGEWYIRNIPFNNMDTALLSIASFHESNNLHLEIIKNSHVKKALFVYNTK